MAAARRLAAGGLEGGLSTPAPSSTALPAHPHLDSPVLPYASPGAGRPVRFTAGGAVIMAVIAAGFCCLLLIEWAQYRARRHFGPSRSTELKSTVQSLRSQVALFKLQHNDRLPGACPLVARGGPFSANQATFWAQVTQYTDLNGYTSPTKSARFCYGPYMQSVASNRLNGSNTIASKPARGVGFVYDFAGGAGSGKLCGVDSSGALVIQ
jgi:hypothetical protein